MSSTTSSEFFEVRVAGIKQQIETDIVERSLDGLTATENYAGTDAETDNTALLSGNCSFTQAASYTKQ